MESNVLPSYKRKLFYNWQILCILENADLDWLKKLIPYWNKLKINGLINN